MSGSHGLGGEPEVPRVGSRTLSPEPGSTSNGDVSWRARGREGGTRKQRQTDGEMRGIPGEGTVGAGAYLLLLPIGCGHSQQEMCGSSRQVLGRREGAGNRGHGAFQPQEASVGRLLSARHLDPSRVKAPLRPMRLGCPETVSLHQFLLGAILCPRPPHT